MNTSSDNIYEFENFRLEANKPALYHRNLLIEGIGDKPLRVLATLLDNPQQLTTHTEIIEKVWQDNPLGINSVHIAQYISKLRKTFTEFEPDAELIRTIKGRGYVFTGEVKTHSAKISGTTVNVNEFLTSEVGENKTDLVKTSVRKSSVAKYFLFALAPIFISFLTIWFWTFPNEAEEIRRVVEESQKFESLVLYKNPTIFAETQLDKYWTAELDISSNADRNRIREAVRKLINEGRRYGDETKCEKFEFQSVEINENRDLAVVKTLEKWFVAVYFNDGTLQKNKYVGPYFVSYILRKIDGRWLIEKSTTARVGRPTPRPADIQVTSEIKSGQQFFVTITGQDFEAETVYLEVTGTGCPENKPCKVPNSALREYSKLSENRLENVPLTLASGDFRVVVRNGDSQVSNPVYLTVP